MLIALGANQAGPAGVPRETAAAAAAALAADGRLRVLRRSRWFRTPAHPPGSGPDFVNGALALETALDPEAVLGLLHAVEASLGRERPWRWAPRVCDLDLLADGDRVLPDRETVRRWMALGPTEAATRLPDCLILPHPRLHERAFVLAPLADVAPNWTHPLYGRTVAEMLGDLSDADRAAAVPLDA